MTVRSSLSVVFAGSGGSGAMTAGTVLLRAAAQAGYYGLMTKLFGPQVRGGEAAALLQISTGPIDSPPDRYDLFVALDWAKVEQFAPEIPLGPDSIILADPVAGPVSPGIAKSKARLVPVPLSDPGMTRLEKAMRGSRANMFAVGTVAAIAGLPMERVAGALAQVLGPKRAGAMEANSAALRTAGDHAKGLGLDFALAPAKPAPRWLISGNEALGLGALRGGVRFIGCYPITPATDLVEWLSPELQSLGGRLVLAEDELASINLCLGASYGGVPAMTVTSGPGLSLMTETLGLAVAAEIPVVVMDVMRGGPSTGLPSKSEQSDLNIAIYGCHGDAPHVVLAPTSVADCVATGERAVYLAESLQLPVIVLSDQQFGQAHAAIDPPSQRPAPLRRRVDGTPPLPAFKRYAVGGEPITAMPVPGTPGYQWVAEGLTHNEVGIPVGAASVHRAQIEKRAKKLQQLDVSEFWGERWGDGDTAIVTFGSSIGPAREAAHRLQAAGMPMRVIGLRVLDPIPTEALKGALAGVSRIVVVEQNHGAQLYRHLVGRNALPSSAESIARMGPLPFRPAELTAHLA